METPKILEIEYCFCITLWKHEPIGSDELVKLCENYIEWKTATTYRVGKRG